MISCQNVIPCFLTFCGSDQSLLSLNFKLKPVDIFYLKVMPAITLSYQYNLMLQRSHVVKTNH